MKNKLFYNSFNIVQRKKLYLIQGWRCILMVINMFPTKGKNAKHKLKMSTKSFYLRDNMKQYLKFLSRRKRAEVGKL